MCVGRIFKIKGVNYRSPLYAPIPCGVCHECRAVYKSGWAFRISSQFEPLIKSGWRMCFYTLTYDNDHIPTLPERIFRDPEHDFWIDRNAGTSRGIICFSRDHMEAYTKHMRDWFLSCGVTDVQYFICSEFGENTSRSHYHGVYVVPPSFDCEALFNEIRDYWTPRYGFLFPRYFNGGKDENGYEHKPFVVKSAYGTMRYIAKYVTKDLAFLDFLRENGISPSSVFTKTRDYRRCMPFHLQTRSIGLKFLESLSDEQKTDLLEKGASFLGDKKKRAVPKYVREKILFDPFYTRSPSGKRLVRRYPTDYFRKNYEKVFDIKCKFLRGSLDLMRKRDDWVSRINANPNFKRLRMVNGNPFYSLDKFALPALHHAGDLANRYGGLDRWMTAYYGQDPQKCYIPFDENPASYWFRRYLLHDDFKPYSLNVRERKDHDALATLVGTFLTIRSWYPSQVSKEKRDSDRLKDFWTNRASWALYNSA